jgi:uncharacterized protein YdeI (YjbR/CyaY-like superfamily)
MAETENLFFNNRDEWRFWLEQNHLTSNGIWIIYVKKHIEKEKLSYNDAVEEALCFGWIDSQIKTIDKDHYMQKYTPRRNGSVWSLLNKKRVAKMIAEGKMTEAGFKTIEQAKVNGNWEKAYTSKKRPDCPQDLLDALSQNYNAFENFARFAPSHQTTYIRWLNAAKRPETRLKRIDKIIQFALANKKPGMA